MSFRPLSLVLAAAAAASALAAPSFASAQDAHRSYQPGGYDACRQARDQRVAGTIIGAIAGAALGSNVSARGARSEGGAIGAVAGGFLGNQIGKGTAAGQACYGYNGAGYRGQPYGYANGPRYDGYRPYGRPHGYAQPDYYRGGEGDEDRYADDRDDERNDDATRSSGGEANGCRMAESPIHMPDGRTEKRLVQVCPDASGRYQVVD